MPVVSPPPWLQTILMVEPAKTTETLSVVTVNINNNQKNLVELGTLMVERGISVALVQESGFSSDPIPSIASALSDLGFTILSHPSEQKRSPCIIIPRSWTITSLKADSDSEAIHADVSSNNGLAIRLISARAPPNLDSIPPSDDTSVTVSKATQLYRTLGQWVAACPSERLLALGIDANETRCLQDRTWAPRRKEKHEARFLGPFLHQHNLIDTYRELHPHAAGYTFNRAQGSASRIDYLITRPHTSLKLTSCSTTRPIHLHDHIPLLLRAEVSGPSTTPPLQPSVRITTRWPRLLSNQQWSHLATLLAQKIQLVRSSWSLDQPEGLDSAITSVSNAFSEALCLARRDQQSNRRPIPLANGARKETNRLHKSLVAVTGLRDILNRMFRGRQPSCHSSIVAQLPSVKRLLCRADFAKEARVTGHKSWRDSDLVDWLGKTTCIVSTLRAKLRQVGQDAKPHVDSLETCFQHDQKSVFDHLFRPRSTNQALAIQHNGKTISGDAALPLMADALKHKFSGEKKMPPIPSSLAALYTPKPECKGLFDNLLDEPSQGELVALIKRSTDGTTSQGPVSMSALKHMLHSADDKDQSTIIEALSAIIATIFRNRSFPHSLLRSIITLIPKARTGAPQGIDSLRPISILHELYKLTTGLIAARMLAILSAHPSILHPSQRGFIRGGSVQQAIAIFVDAMEDAKERGNEAPLFVSSIDLSAAYDKIQRFSLKMTLERFCLPEPAIDLLTQTLNSSWANVQSTSGTLSEAFSLTTGVRQGCPLAPLLFTLVSDALFTGLDTPSDDDATGYFFSWPRTHPRISISSTAYADDTTILSSSYYTCLKALDFASSFFDFHCMLINKSKSFITSTLLPSVAEQKYDPSPLPLVAPSTFWRHLGLRVSLTLDWSEACKQLKGIVGAYTKAMINNRCSTLIRVEAWRAWGLAKVDTALVNACIPKSVLTALDRQVRLSVLSSTSVMAMTSFPASAFHSVTNIPRLADRAAARRCMELLKRLNDPATMKPCIARLLQAAQTEDLGLALSSLQESKSSKCSDDSPSWALRALAAARKFGLRLRTNESHWKSASVTCTQANNEDAVLDHCNHLRADPSSLQLLSTPTIADSWIAFTDGSTSPGTALPSGIGVLLMGENSKCMIEKHSAIKAGGNNFVAEAAAILLAIQMAPMNHALTVITDCKGACDVLGPSFDRSSLGSRTPAQWSRLGARAIFRGIYLVCKQRTAPTRFEWTPSHAGDGTWIATGNDRADVLANRGRVEAAHEDISYPCFLEDHVVAHMSDDDGNDILCTGDLKPLIKDHIASTYMAAWCSLPSARHLVLNNQAEVARLSAMIRREGRSDKLCFILEALTGTSDSVHRRTKLAKGAEASWLDKYSDNDSCLFCGGSEESTHYLSCPRLMRRFVPLIKAAQHAADPLHLLPANALEWCYGDFLRPGSNTSEIKVTDDSWPELVESFAYHSSRAGALGILPPTSLKLYQAYWSAALPEAPTKQIQRQATATMAATRTALFKVAFCAWKLWRTHKKRNIATKSKALRRRARQAIILEADKSHARSLAEFREHAANVASKRRRALTRWKVKQRVPRFRASKRKLS